MPELPEVESVCRLMRTTLLNQKLAVVKVADDPIVLRNTPVHAVEQALQNRRIQQVGRRGKFWWLSFDEPPWVLGHLGMTGWIESLKADEEDPRFLKLRLTTENGVGISFTDPRRFGRLWLAESLSLDPFLKKLGPDALLELPDTDELENVFSKRSVAIKAVLLDQSTIAGIGNYLADEVLYQAGIAPAKSAKELSRNEVLCLRSKIVEVLDFAVSVTANYDRFPEHWLFHHRWGGAKGKDQIEGRNIVRETIGGRTTAWVPELQK